MDECNMKDDEAMDYENVVQDDSNIAANEIEQTLAEKESEVLSLFISADDHAAVSHEDTITSEIKNACNDSSTNFTTVAAIHLSEDGIEQETVSTDVLTDNLLTEEIVETELAAQAVENETVQQDVEIVDENQKLIKIDSDGTATIEFNAADASWITLLDNFEYILNEDRIRGYVEGEKYFMCLWERFLTSTLSSFSIRSSDRYYRAAKEGEEGAIFGRIIKGTAKWSHLPLIPYDGVPFVFMDRKYFGCRHGGPERKNKQKGQLTKQRKANSMKVGCTAEAAVLEVWRVPDLKVPDDVNTCRKKRREKPKLLAQVKEFILAGRFVRRYYVTLPLINNHQNHPVLDVQAGRIKYLHPKIIEKIYELVEEGIFDKRVIKFMLEKYVEDYQKEFGIEIQRSDRAFYPTDRDIQNHIRNARKATEQSEVKSGDFTSDCDVIHETVSKNDDISYSQEVVASSFHDIVSVPTDTNETYISSQDTPDILHEGTVTVSGEFNDSYTATTVDSSSNYVTSDEVGTVSIDGIVPSDVMDYYNTTGATTVDQTMKLLLESTKKQKKTERKWPLKPSKLKTKERDIQVLLRDEIQRSLALINVGIQEENDESKLHVILKKVKHVQRIVEGRLENRTAVRRQEQRKNNGVLSMMCAEKTEGE